MVERLLGDIGPDGLESSGVDDFEVSLGSISSIFTSEPETKDSLPQPPPKVTKPKSATKSAEAAQDPTVGNGIAPDDGPTVMWDNLGDFSLNDFE